MSEQKQIQFENLATVEGEVLSSTIERKEFKDENNKSYYALAGEIVLKTGENETHTARYFVKEKTKNGQENKIYTNVSKALENLVTLEDIATHKEFEGATPSKLRVRGELSLNEFYNDADQLQSKLVIRGVFLNRVKEENTYAPKAEFDVEGIVVGVAPEIDKDENETGRVKVKLLIPTYNSALPIEFISRPEDGDYIQDNFESGMTVNIYGKIVNYSKKIVIKKEAGFGESKEETRWENTRELQIAGGKIYEEDSPKTLEPEQIQELSTKRNVYLAQLKEKRQQNQKQQKSVGFGQNPQPTQNTSKPKVDISNLF